MVWTIALAVMLAAKPAAPVKLAAPGLSGLNVNADELAFFTEHLAQQLTLAGLQVTTAKQISSLIGLERQKEIMGCKDAATACMAELASALGVDGVVSGSVGKFEKSYRVNVSIIAATDGHVLSAYSARAASPEEVLEQLTTAAQQMAAEVKKLLRGSAPPPPPAPVPAPELRVAAPPARQPNVRPEVAPAPPASWGLRPVAWIPAAGAGAFAIAGAVFAVRAGSMYGQAKTWTASDAQPRRYEDAAQLVADGKLSQTLSIAGFGVAAAGLAVATVFFLSGDPAHAPSAALHLAPAPGGVALTGSW